MDFRYEPETGRIAYIETNARFTGGLATPVAAGFDIPWVMYKLATEGKYDEQIKVRIGTRTKWILGDVITLVGRILKMKRDPKELKRVFSFRGVMPLRISVRMIRRLSLESFDIILRN